MKRLRVLLAIVACLAVVGFVGWRVFEHFEQQDKIKDAGASCASLDQPTGTPTLPAGFTLPAGQKLLRVQTVGKTNVVYASLPGGRSDLVAIRDRVAQELVATGYRVTGTDQEPTFEAEATLSRADVDDTLNVRPLCSGKAVVRYTLH